MPRRVQHDSTQLRLYGCTSEDLSAKTTRSGRISYKPLEYWNFEQLNKTVDQDGHIKVVRKKTEVLSLRDKEFFPNDTSLICREPLTPKQIQSRLCTSTWTHKPVRRKGHVGSISKSNRSFVNKSGRLDSKPNHYSAEDTEKEGIPKKALSVNMKDRNKEEGSLPKPRLNISLITKSGRNSCTPVRYGMIPPDGLQNKKQVIKKYVEWAKIYPSSLFERSPKVCLKRLSPNKLRMNKAPKGIRPRMRTPKKRDHLKEKDLCIEELDALPGSTHKEVEAVVCDKPKDIPMQDKKHQRSKKKKLDTLSGRTHKENEAVVCDKPKDVPMQDKKHRSRKKKNKLTNDENFEAVSKAADCQEAVDQEKCESMGNEVPFKDKVDKPIKQKSAEKIYHFELKELAWSDDKDSQNEASAPAVPSPEKRKKENSSRICFTSVTEAEDSSVKVTRFGRLSYKPLEYWNFERLDQEKTDEGKVKLMRNKSEIKGRKVVSKVSSQVIPETTSGPLSQRAPSPKSRKIDEPSLDSSYKEEEKIVKKFNDLKFYRLEGDKNLVVYVAQGLCMPEERIETGFIFLQKGNFVWTISAGCMKVQVLKGHGVLNLEGAEKTQRDITEGSLFHVEAGQKFTVRNHFGVESPVLKMFILKYY